MAAFEGKNEKKSQCRKIWKRGPISLVRFRKCSKKFLAKARNHRTSDRWVHRKPSKVSTKKWYMHDEVCGLTKKIATVIVGLFSLEKRGLKTSRERPKSAPYLMLQIVWNFGENRKKIGVKNENVVSKLWKRYIRTLKTLYPNFGNVLSEYPLVPLGFLDHVKYVASLHARWKL